MNADGLLLHAIHHLPGELAARRVDVVAARPANGGDEAGVEKDLLEALDAIRGGTLESRVGKGVEGNEVHLARHLLQQARELLRVVRRVVHPLEHTYSKVMKSRG